MPRHARIASASAELEQFLLDSEHQPADDRTWSLDLFALSDGSAFKVASRVIRCNELARSVAAISSASIWRKCLLLEHATGIGSMTRAPRGWLTLRSVDESSADSFRWLRVKYCRSLGGA